MDGNGEAQVTADAILQIRGRVHKLADMVQGHDATIIEHRTVIPLLMQDLKTLRAEAATREGVKSAFDTLKLQMESSSTLYALKLQAIDDKLAPIQRGVYWVVGLVLTAVLLALLALVLHKT